jgi:hypothetical protein
VTNGEFVSRVVNGLRALNKDDHISRRYILRIGQNKSKFYISQKLLDKSLFKEDNLFRYLNCFRLTDEDRIKCGIYEFARCESLMKSTKKIPGLVYSRYGASIISITSIDGLTRFVPTTLSNYALFRDRQNADKFKGRTKFFYIKEGYLYLPDSEIEMVNIVYIPFEESAVDKASECSDGSSCTSVWDMQFVVPDKLSEQVITETINEVFTSRKVVVDENPNLDTNIKSSTTR